MGLKESWRRVRFPGTTSKDSKATGPSVSGSCMECGFIAWATTDGGLMPSYVRTLWRSLRHMEKAGVRFDRFTTGQAAVDEARPFLALVGVPCSLTTRTPRGPLRARGGGQMLPVRPLERRGSSREEGLSPITDRTGHRPNRKGSGIPDQSVPRRENRPQ